MSSKTVEGIDATIQNDNFKWLRVTGGFANGVDCIGARMNGCHRAAERKKLFAQGIERMWMVIDNEDVESSGSEPASGR